MGVSGLQPSTAPDLQSISALPKDFLNCYEILNASELSWPVSLYAVDREDGDSQAHEQRSAIKDCVWKLLRGAYKHVRKGPGFVIDISPRLVALPSAWTLPVPLSVDGYRIGLERSFVATPHDSTCRAVVEGVIREGIKDHFKKVQSDRLGQLWQDFNGFCQAPAGSGAEFLICRRFGFAAKVLNQQRWTVQFTISTVSVDNRCFEDYYRGGEVARLAEMIRVKRKNRVDRDNRPVTIRVLHSTDLSSRVQAIDFDDVDLIFEHSALPRLDQASLTRTEFRCRSFPSGLKKLPASEIRLILDSQITQEDHAETILEPREREELMRALRYFVNGTNVQGQILELSDVPIDANSLGGVFVLPPAVCVRGADGKRAILESPLAVSDQCLAARGRERAERIRRYGFLEQRPISPALAWPEELGEGRGRRMAKDLDYICERQGVAARFDFVHYRNAGDIRRALEARRNDAVLIVLPELSSSAGLGDDTHERVKRALDVPSQCICHDHTLPQGWVFKPWRDFSEAKPQMARKIRQRYELALANLLVKHHWFPFAPASPFHYNVQVGLDVGGVHNNVAMACLGYGFQSPQDLLLFRPEEIPIEFQKKEPIPTGCLFRGLLALFESVHEQLASEGITPNFETALFYRDGQFMGDGDKWNEIDALRRLHSELLRRGWVSAASAWSGVDVMKGAEGWRLLRTEDTVTNPLVGKCVFAFEDERLALVSTTGVPYLTQGTAKPLKVKIVDIYGPWERERVLRDLVWQCDMCFTKPDMGLALPWVLHVADCGALQLSRSYKISGITA
jgi:hypothetical protein